MCKPNIYACSYATCLEGALKIKELTYMHSEGIQRSMAEKYIIFIKVVFVLNYKTELMEQADIL